MFSPNATIENPNEINKSSQITKEEMGQTALDYKIQSHLLQISKREDFKRKYQILEDFITTPPNMISVTPKRKEDKTHPKHE